MAGPSNTTDIPVDLVADGSDVSRVMDQVQAKLEKALAAVNKISASADAGVKNFDRKLDQSIKQLQRAMSQISTLEKSMYAGAGGVRQLNQAQQFGKSTEAAARFAGTVKNAGNAVEAVSARINDLTKQAARLGQQDFLPKQKMLRAQENLRNIERELRSIDRTMDRLNTKARQNGGDFAAQQRQVADAQTALFRALQDGRRTNFTNELNQLRDATARYGADVRRVDADLRRQGQAYDQLVIKARQYANETRFAQEGRLRREAGRLGVPADASTEGATERLAAATIRASVARERLNAALQRGAGQAELAKAVATYERYNARLVESVALHNRLQAELKESAAAQARQAAEAARSQAASGRRGPVGTILSAEYGAAAFARTSVYGGAAALAYGAFNTLRDGARFVIEFSDALANLQAIAGATDGQMTQLKETILDVASGSKFSTIDLAKAATTLAQAGFSTREMQDSLAAVSELATASGSTIAESVDLITGAVGAFQLQASEAARISDLLVSSLNRSKLTVTQVAQAIQYVGATAYESNISLNELVAAAGAIANAGVRSGSTIGTGMRQFLVDLQDPTKKLSEELTKLGLTQADVDVKTRGLSAVLTTLRDAGFGTAQAYAGLETRAAAAFLVLKNNIGTMNELTLAQLAQGQATEASAAAMGSLSAEWQRWKNNLNEQVSSGTGPLERGLANLFKWSSDTYELEKKRAKDGAAFHAQAIYHTEEAIRQSRERVAQLEREGNYREAAAERERLGFAEAVQRAREMGSDVEAAYAQATGGSLGFADQVAATGEEIAAQQTTISSLDEALAKLLLQEERLRTEQGALGAETAMLSTRFMGLSAHLQNNTRDFNGAILAVRQYRAELSATLLEQLRVQQGLLIGQRGEQRGAARVAFRNADRNVTSADGRRVLQALANDPSNPLVRQMALDYSKRSGVSSFEAKAMEQAAKSAAAWDTTNRNLAIANRQISYTSAELNPGAQKNREGLEKVTAILGQLGPQTSTMSSGERKGLYSPIAEQSEAAARAARERARDASTQGERDLWNQRADEWHSLAQQAAAAFSSVGEKKTSTGRTDRAGAREARRRLNAHKSVSDAALKSAAMDLDEALEDNTEPLNYQEFKEGKDEIEKALANWVTKRQELMKDEVAAKGLKGDEAENYRREIANQIESKREEIAKKIAENIRSMLENAVEAADREFERAMQPFEDGIKMAEGRRKALDRTGVRNSIPDYVRKNADFRLEQQEEARDRASISRNDNRIAQLADAYTDMQRAVEALKTSAQVEDDYRSVIDAVAPDGSEGLLVVADVMKKAADATGNFTDKELKELTLKLVETAVNIHNLRVENDAMRASFEGAAAIPQTIGDAFTQAAEAYSRANQLNVGLRESINNNLYDAITEAHGAFTTFFSDMVTKPQEVLANFGNFAKSILRILQDMAAQALANEIFGMILNLGASLLGGSTKTPGGVASPNGRLSVGIGANFNGGLIGRAEGGLVTEGVPNRDSVATMLARDEFVVRKAAVDSVGVDFMRDLNKRGARALQGMGSNIVPLQPTKVDTNVYVIAPEEKPQLGPNDVIAVVNNELLKDGTTKRLIKHVSNGG